MTIKIKIKHLVLWVLGPAILLIVILNSVPSLAKLGQSTPTESSPENARIQLLQQLNSSTGNPHLELIRKKIIDTGSRHSSYLFDVYIGPTSSHWSVDEVNSINLLPADRITFLDEYIREGPVDDYYIRASKQLVYEYDSLSREDDAEQALITAESRISSNTSTARELALLRGERALDRGDVAAAETILEKSTSPSYVHETELDGRMNWLKARLLFTKGNFKQAHLLVKSSLKTYRNNKDSLKLVTDTERQLVDLQAEIESAMNIAHTDSANLSGTLARSDGTPIPFAGIFLRDESHVNHSVTDSEPYRILTDSEGHFQFHGVIPGYYQLELGLHFNQIDGWTWPIQFGDWIEIKQGENKLANVTLQPLLELHSPVNQQIITDKNINFSWEAVTGAAYYNLNGSVWSENSSYTNQIKGHVTDNHVTIPINELYYTSGGFSFGSQGDWQSIKPNSLLGFTNPDNRYSWSIEAFDTSGKLITRSNGYRLDENRVGNLPFFYLKERTLSNADRILLDKKPDQAIVAYQQDYAANPQDLHALHMLVHLLRAKDTFMESKPKVDSTIPLIKKLLQMYPSEGYASTLTQYFYEQADWKQYNEYYSLYLSVADQKPNSYMRAINALALWHQGEVDRARKELAISLEEDNNHRFIGGYLALELYAGEALSSVSEIAARYPDHSGEPNGNRWTSLLSQLTVQRAQHPEVFDKQLKEKLDWYMLGKSELLKQWMDQTDASALKKFMGALLEVR
ncbi:carboxypeptidase-like regulatory domain-containing protein [Paenibacillus wynnii]|uniref:Carboxypeptidase regulatory-like domain-containing protein n=1 Tax=Paenibacillus wynnii TaxID=268407 RepID=A0A098MAK3_9BACL|nr:carboxypeptidase-like regulatory domain-containing protein [Paenibacillus wynnii]KGE19091.1 hypothetical protein PWYN_06835 [Paenibacillus wynnii]